MQPQERLLAPRRSQCPDSKGRFLNANEALIVVLRRELLASASQLSRTLLAWWSPLSPISPIAPLDLHYRPRMQLCIPRYAKGKKLSDEN